MNDTQALHTWTVETPQAGARLDRWLTEHLPDQSRSRLKALIEDGCVTIGGQVTLDASRKVRAGDQIALAIPEAVAAQPQAESIPLVVVYEDADLIVVDKPAGMVVHPAPGSHSATLVNALLHHCAGSLSGIGGEKRPGIVHRLDKDTSGLIVAAKTDIAHRGLATQFAAHTITRAYKALCWGVPMPRSGSIAGNIGRSTHDRKKMAVLKRGGREALTNYKVERVFGTVAALVECRLATGRTHQIRVHMASIGHSLVGDATYGGRARLKKHELSQAAEAALRNFHRQALHAWQLGFSHPATGERLLFGSNIPNDFNDLLNSLGEM
ncbi:MAG TPA: RluA family pseudouridine synthase [Magnetospirillaceae bacterium]|jgi:23S rRNA pseudouridine1911/1915/1917 synthase